MPLLRLYSGLTCRLAVLALGAGLLAGCAASEQDSTSRFLVAPGRYVLFNCPQIALQAKQNSERQRELEALMAKAGDDSAGRLVSAVAYKPEYFQLRGEMADLRREALDKKCKFVPGEDRSARPVGVGASR